MEFRDLKQQYKYLKPEIDTNIFKVMSEAKFISGRPVQELEEQLAEYVGTKYCVTCANGTDALQLALMAWNIGAGDAVFVPDFTFFATGEVVAHVGATPVFVDVQKDTFNISPECLEQAIQKILLEGKLKPKVIVAVDLFGQPADYDKIYQLAEKYRLLVLEDGAQGFGGSIREKKACSFGHIGTTSFFPAKPLGCYGDGGAVFTDNSEWVELIRSYCVHGKGTSKYDNVRIGMNSRLDTIQAAILQVKLRHFIEHELTQVNQVAAWYSEYLPDTLVTPSVRETFKSSWAQYTVICRDSMHRLNLQEALKKEEIPTAIYYNKGMHEQKAFQGKYVCMEQYENTSYLVERVLSLPMHPYMEKSDVLKIADMCKNV